MIFGGAYKAMKKRRLLITGGTGLLAVNWAFIKRTEWDVFLCIHNRKILLCDVSWIKIDLSDRDALMSEFLKIAPDLIVHTAGMTNVDECENNPKIAYFVNAEISKNIADCAAKLKTPLIHISTDHLFSGNKSYSLEVDEPHPLNVYAHTKLLAETNVLIAHPDSLILRTNFFGWGHKFRMSFSDWVISSLRAGNQISLFDDVFITPILIDNFVIAAHELIEKGANGVFNLVGGEKISKYGFGIQIANQFSLNSSLIIRSTIKDVKLAARRPNDMSLSNAKAAAILERPLGGICENVRGLLDQELLGRSKELQNIVTSPI